jgi:UDP-N-acetylmuramyl pentapeptide phosphotransferase/UDP-N-acetylglucosamine-1-phosphate transferase
MITENSTYLIFFSGGYLVARFLLPSLFFMLNELGAVKKNWQGILIPGMAGLAFPLIIGMVSVPMLILGLLEHTHYVFLLAILLISLLGLLDDVLGNTGPKGLRGHITYSWQQKRLTTGIVKAMGTGVVSLGVVYFLKVGILEWLLVTLAVNSINLLDLRPGRAIKGTGLFLMLALFFPLSDYWLICITSGILIAYAPYDLHGLVMLGDTGSNVLGMITGLVLLQVPYIIKVLLIIVLTGFHLLTEKYSFSVIIERYKLLRRIDQWGQR